MLAKKYRLPIQLFYKKTGKAFRSRNFLLKIFVPETNYSRFGVVISRKVSPKAVERNRLKRIIFNVFQEKMATLPTKDYLVILSSGAAQLDKSEFVKELLKTL